MDFLSEIVLENESVKLQPLTANDVGSLLNFSLNEPELWRYSLLPADGEDNLKKYIEFALEDRKNQKGYPFLVIDKTSGEVAGSTRFYDFQRGHNTVQLGYTWFGKKFQGTGLNKKCKFLMLEFAFDCLKLDRVEFRADGNNKKSIAAMKSIGCTEEGILRSNCLGPYGRRDSIVLSILRSEWNDSIKEALRRKCE